MSITVPGGIHFAALEESPSPAIDLSVDEGAYSSLRFSVQFPSASARARPHPIFSTEVLVYRRSSNGTSSTESISLIALKHSYVPARRVNQKRASHSKRPPNSQSTRAILQRLSRARYGLQQTRSVDREIARQIEHCGRTLRNGQGPTRLCVLRFHLLFTDLQKPGCLHRSWSSSAIPPCSVAT